MSIFTHIHSLLTKPRTIKFAGLAALCASMMGVSMMVMAPVFAESAPVYDADNLPQQGPGMDPGSNQGMEPAGSNQAGMDQGQGQNQAMDDSTDQSQYPPPPEQDMGGAFAPMPAQPSPPTVASAPADVPSGSPRVAMNMDRRMRKMEQQINNMLTSDAANRMESLQNQVQALRGQVEELTHQLQQLQAEQKSLYTDLDKRLSQVDENAAKQAAVIASAPPPSSSPGGEDARAAVSGGSTESNHPSAAKFSRSAAKAAKRQGHLSVTSSLPPTSVTDQPNVAEEQQIYQTAYNLIKAKKYSDAVNALQGMLKKYPRGQFASNAHYWLGELYGLMEKNDLALTEFSVVIRNYPDSPRVSDAQLKVGLILAAQLKWPDAKAALKKVINHYPGTASARLASEHLKQIKQAGH